MATSWNSIFQRIAHVLGAVKGAKVADAETNFIALLSSATLIGPDYTESPIKNAAVSALGQIVKAISETPLHPEWADFRALTTALASGAQIPASVGSVPRIGRIGSVLDSGDAEPLERATLDVVRSYNRYKTTLYSQSSPNKFAISADTIEHTRTAVVVEVFCFQAPTDFSGNIPIRDMHDRTIICGGVLLLAPKESMYRELFEMADKIYMADIASIRELGNPQAYTEASAAPSNI